MDGVGEGLFESWFRRRAHRIKPAADVDLGMSLPAVMAGSGRVGGFSIPSVYSEMRVSTSNDKPMSGIGGDEPTDFTPEFLQLCHVFAS
jgi:hypothetical protein